jgi:release factor glutamine methyltransferase
MLQNSLQRYNMNSHEAFITLCQILEKQYKNKIQAQQYAQWTLETIAQQTLAQLIANPIIITPLLQTKINHWTEQLIEHEEPIQYLIGTVQCGPLEIFVEHPVLIPRPETEEWVMSLASEIKNVMGNCQPLRILDACTGSGCITLLLASLFPKAEVVGIDNADHAITLAEKNKAHLKISNASFVKADITTYQPTKLFDLIVSNPPYIDHDDWLMLSPSVTAWEDYHALVADDQGYALIEILINKSSDWLKTDSMLAKSQLPQLVIEIGHEQGQKTLELAQQNPRFYDAKINQDYAGKDRVLYAFTSK